MNLSYILNQLGEEREKYYHAVSPPVIQSSNFAFESVRALRTAFKDTRNSQIYTRGNNPTVGILAKKIAALAGAEDALVLSSGAAAISAAVISQVRSGDHIVCVNHPYSWTERLCRVILSRFGVETTFIDGRSPEAWEAAMRPNTTVFILESPNTFTFEMQDISAVAAYARSKNITTIIDNTYCTPLGQRCIEMGIDLEVHSSSKYLNGHSDIVAGVVTGSAERIGRIHQSELMNLGAVISPHDAWLMLRGLRTLPIRMKQISESTAQVIAFLNNQPAVSALLYPMAADNPQLELAQRQMKWCGGLFSILLNTESIEAVEQFCDALKYFKMAVSWGGHESLIMPACAFYDQSYEGVRTYPANLVRVYVGLESADELINDLKQALRHIV